MPTTGDTWINLETGMILDFAALQSNLVELTRDNLATVRSDIYGQDATIGSNKATFTVASSTIDLDAPRFGVTPDGYRIHADTAGAAGAAWQQVPYEDNGATIYHVGARRQIRPATVTGNTADGGYYYDTEVEDVGELGAPDAVSDQGGGAGLFIDVDSLVAPGWTVADTRPVVVYLVDPVTASADAIYTGTVAWDAGAGVHRITVPHYFGQDAASPSTTAADYRVLVQGPTISTTPLGSDPNYWHLGKVQSGVHDPAAQNLNPTWGSWLSLFGTEHDTANGKHTGIKAHGVTLYGGQAGSKLRQAYPAHALAAYFHGAEQVGGGTGQVMQFNLADGSQPHRIETGSPVSGTHAWLEFPARFPVDQGFSITRLAVGARIEAPSGTEKLQVELVSRDPLNPSTKPGVVLGTWELTGIAAATWEHRDTWTGPAFPAAVAKPPSDESLFWRIYFYEPNPGRVRVSTFEVESEASRLEPWS